jgi:hypothetical protein
MIAAIGSRGFHHYGSNISMLYSQIKDHEHVDWNPRKKLEASELHLNSAVDQSTGKRRDHTISWHLAFPPIGIFMKSQR